MREVLDHEKRRFGKKHDRTAQALQNLAWDEFHLNDFQSAFQHFDEAVSTRIAIAEEFDASDGSRYAGIANEKSVFFGRVFLSYILAEQNPLKESDLRGSAYVIGQWMVIPRRERSGANGSTRQRQ